MGELVSPNSTLHNPFYGTRARERGVSRAVEILSGREMFSAAEFAKFIGVSREAVRGKHQRGEVLGLHGAKRGLRFPKWQARPNSNLLRDEFFLRLTLINESLT